MRCASPNESKCPSYTEASLGASELKSHGWAVHSGEYKTTWKAASPLPIEAQMLLNGFRAAHGLPAYMQASDAVQVTTTSFIIDIREVDGELIVRTRGR